MNCDAWQGGVLDKRDSWKCKYGGTKIPRIVRKSFVFAKLLNPANKNQQKIDVKEVKRKLRWDLNRLTGIASIGFLSLDRQVQGLFSGEDEEVSKKQWHSGLGFKEKKPGKRGRVYVFCLRYLQVPSTTHRLQIHEHTHTRTHYRGIVTSNTPWFSTACQCTSPSYALNLYHHCISNLPQSSLL